MGAERVEYPASVTQPAGRWRPPDAPLRGRVLIAQAIGLALVASVALAVRAALSLGALYPLKALAVFAVVAATASGFVRDRHPFPRFGPANHTTTLRAALVALVAALIAESSDARAAAIAVAATLLIEALDGVDGWLARRGGMSSEFGARYDMEVDSLLGLVLAGLAWQYGKAGPWILLAGLLRYLFVAAGWLAPFLRQPLPPSRRRQAVCVIQIIGLTAVIAPAVAPPLSSVLGAVVLVVLSSSFAIDVAWLGRASARLTSGPKLEYR